MKVCITFTEQESKLADLVSAAITIAAAPIRLSKKLTAPRDGYIHLYIESPKNCPIIHDSLTI